MSKHYLTVLCLAMFSTAAVAQPFPMNERGEYLANVEVVLSDREGKRPAIKFNARAPICLVQAPAGRYQVEALFRNDKRTLAATVAKDAKQPGMLVFRFPGTE